MPLNTCKVCVCVSHLMDSRKAIHFIYINKLHSTVYFYNYRPTGGGLGQWEVTCEAVNRTCLHVLEIAQYDFHSYPQSGAGHQRQSGSEARHRLSRNSSYFSNRAASSRISATCLGANLSAHSGQLSCTRLSVISMRRYWRRQQRQERWLQPWSSASWSRGWRTRHSGHSRSSCPPREAWLVDKGSAVSAVRGSGEAAVGVGGWRSCCCCWLCCWAKGVPELALLLLEPRLLWKRLAKEILLCFLPGPRHLGLGMPLTDEWGESESFSDPIAQEKSDFL